MVLRIASQYHDLITEKSKLEKTIKKQFSLLEEIESKYPGLTKLKTKEDGSIVFDDEDPDEVIQSFQLKGE